MRTEGNERANRKREASRRRARCLRNVAASVSTASFVAMTFHLRGLAQARIENLPFQWQMLSCMLGGYTLPLLALLCVAICGALFWNREGRE